MWKTKGSIEEGVKGRRAFQHILILGIKKEEDHDGDPREISQCFNAGEVSPINTQATHTHTFLLKARLFCKDFGKHSNNKTVINSRANLEIIFNSSEHLTQLSQC